MLDRDAGRSGATVSSGSRSVPHRADVGARRRRPTASACQRWQPLCVSPSIRTRTKPSSSPSSSAKAPGKICVASSGQILRQRHSKSSRSRSAMSRGGPSAMAVEGTWAIFRGRNACAGKYVELRCRICEDWTSGRSMLNRIWGSAEATATPRDGRPVLAARADLGSVSLFIGSGQHTRRIQEMLCYNLAYFLWQGDRDDVPRS